MNMNTAKLDSETARTVALTILSQIGHGALYMLGAKDKVIHSEGCGGASFRIGRNSKKVTHVQVMLAGDDTYTMSFLWIRAGNRKVRAIAEGVYFDQLRPTIEQHTGLYTSL
jgi:hypothetical protein